MLQDYKSPWGTITKYFLAPKQSPSPSPSASRYSAPNHERANASAPPGGAAGRARLHRGDAHPERLGYCRLLWCPVHTRDTREGRKRTRKYTHIHCTCTVLHIRAAESWWRDGACHSLMPASFLPYHSTDMWSALYWLHTHLPVKI